MSWAENAAPAHTCMPTRLPSSPPSPDPPDVPVCIGGGQQGAKLWRRKGQVLHRQAAGRRLLEQRRQAPRLSAAHALGPHRHAAVGGAARQHAPKIGRPPGQRGDAQALCRQGAAKRPGLAATLALPHLQPARSITHSHTCVRQIVCGSHGLCAPKRCRHFEFVRPHQVCCGLASASQCELGGPG